METNEFLITARYSHPSAALKSSSLQEEISSHICNLICEKFENFDKNKVSIDAENQQSFVCYQGVKVFNLKTKIFTTPLYCDLILYLNKI